MAICLFCSQKSSKIGELCASCNNGYTVHENHGKDSAGLLGKFIANKFVPTSVISESDETIYYEAFQPAVDRKILFVYVKPSFVKSPANKSKLYSFMERYSCIKQQNTPNLLEVIELPEQDTIAFTFEAIKGECITSYLTTHQLDPVSLMHVIHQIIQAYAAYHAKGIVFSHIGPENIHIFRSGSDDCFIKITGMLNVLVSSLDKPPTPKDDVYSVGQIALSLILGKPIPVKVLELPPERAFFMPIVQLFLRAIAPKEERFESCVELLQAFEIAFDLNAHSPDPSPVVSAKNVAAKRSTLKHTPIPFDQIIWMHRPPKAL